MGTLKNIGKRVYKAAKGVGEVAAGVAGVPGAGRQGLDDIQDSVDDIQLNKSGTVGTEPIGKVGKDGKVKRYTEIKAGKLGKLDIPRFKKGGMVKKTGLAVVHKGEKVLTAKQVVAQRFAKKKSMSKANC